MSKKKSVLSVVERTDSGSGASRKARREGRIPGIIYGHGVKSKSFLIPEGEWLKLAKHGNIHLVELKPENGDVMNAIVKEVQFDYLSGKTLHIDFLEVKMDQLITTSVDVIGHGTPVGIIQGGVLEQILHKIEVRCLPKDIPEIIDIEISGIELEKAIYVKDIQLPEGVTASNPPDSVVFHVIKLRIEEEAVATPAEGAVAEGAEGAVEPELVATKGKKLEEGEEAEVAAKGKDAGKDKGKETKEKKK
jgi:large subunit ribosomal protein L25